MNTRTGMVVGDKSTLEKKVAEKTKYLLVRSYIKTFLINRGRTLMTPTRTIIELLIQEFDISEEQASNYIKSFIQMCCQPSGRREFELYFPYIKSRGWAKKHGYLRWKGTK
jgi:hypothetical protein